MKRFVLVTFAALALGVPSMTAAQGVDLVYRPELRGMIAVPRQPLQRVAPAAVRNPNAEIARHEAMAHAYRGTRIAQAAVHCDRMIQEAREARKQF